MIKVLIVDDEPKLREGLRTFIDWGAYGYEVVDTAANGNEALEKYQQYLPDLVVADIRMPGMDGLQLIEKLRTQDPNLHILILSGYADFSYAKKAMTHRADGYLLKPVDEDELKDYLWKIKLTIDEERASEQWKHVTTEWNREALIQSVLTGEDEEDSTPLCERAHEVGISGKVFQILLLAPQMEGDTDAHINALIRKTLVRQFEETGRGWVFAIHSKFGALLKEPLLSVELTGIYRELAAELADLGIRYSVAIGEKVGCMTEIRESYRTACDLVRRHFFLDQGTILTPDSLSAGTDPVAGSGIGAVSGRGTGSDVNSGASPSMSAGPELSTDELGEQLFYAVDIGNRDAVKSLLHQLGEAYKGEGAMENEIKNRYVELLTTIFSKALKQSPELQNRSKEFSDGYSKIQKAYSILELNGQAEQLLQQIMNQLGEDGKHREVKIMLDLIHRNYSENLKLETLSGIFNYNSAYLGKLFKNTTGEYFNTYLDKVRIEKAKHYLEEGLKVYQVAEKVGYTNVDYFHSKFRKYVGTSPSAYRKQMNHA
ncbi:response regulator transcription factor [Paenibacillus barengoltzii]|uniref:Two-component system, response regulator YesN n=1 Tax=Paenibacillus barengoltzii J12 TaxID=935846 RepID=A0ABY1LS25_9BACL|nr:response regulator transcription factor [Paenibacillus barengoltzii]SME90617.1 two-component system, response regulator YesN [Paenibacillus barengoltzii J12]